MTALRAILLSLVVAGCEVPVDGSSTSSGPPVTISVLSGPPGAGLTSSTATTLVGVAIPLDVETSDPDSTKTVSIHAVDPTVVTVIPRELPNIFFVIGWAPGTTALSVILNGQAVDELTVAGEDAASVVGQP